MTLRSIDRRLNRPIPGERQLMVYDTVIAASERLARKPPVQDRIPLPREPLSSGKTRSTRLKPRCEPNAPQLIRLVRSPFAVEPTFNRKRPPRDRPQPRPERLPYHAQIAEALDRPVPHLPSRRRELLAAPAPRLWRLKDPA